MLLHVDTDLGSNPDDAAAVVMAFGWPGLQLCGVTTGTDADGRRAGWAAYLAELAGHPELPVRAGSARPAPPAPTPAALQPTDWPDGVRARPPVPGAACDLLARSVRAGATLVGIGPLTNLAELADAQPAVLGAADVVVMGGWLAPPPAGYPQWGPWRDYNVVTDPVAAGRVLAGCGRVTLVPAAVTVRCALRGAHLPALRRAGPLGSLLAEQLAAHARRRRHGQLAARAAAVPADLVAFLHDPLALAVAAGWPGVRVATRRLRLELAAGPRWHLDPDGVTVRVVTDVDADAFVQKFLAAVTAASRAAAGRARTAPS